MLVAQILPPQPLCNRDPHDRGSDGEAPGLIALYGEQPPLPGWLQGLGSPTVTGLSLGLGGLPAAATARKPAKRAYSTMSSYGQGFLKMLEANRA